eukprot:6175376-Pleurochrysis_carterae.AAC.2
MKAAALLRTFVLKSAVLTTSHLAKHVLMPVAATVLMAARDSSYGAQLNFACILHAPHELQPILEGTKTAWPRQ